MVEKRELGDFERVLWENQAAYTSKPMIGDAAAKHQVRMKFAVSIGCSRLANILNNGPRFGIRAALASHGPVAQYL